MRKACGYIALLSGVIFCFSFGVFAVLSGKAMLPRVKELGKRITRRKEQ